MNQSQQIIEGLAEAGFVDMAVTTSREAGHTHMVIIPKDLVNDAGGEFETTPNEKNGHIHRVIMSGAMIVAAQTGQPLDVMTTEDDEDQHSHKVKFRIKRVNPQ